MRHYENRAGTIITRKTGWKMSKCCLVAAIVILGIRSFFVQPFIIPTNSMYPSFYGMTPHVYEDESPQHS